MNIARELVAGLNVPAQVRHRILPAQPSGTPSGAVYCGIDLSFLPYDGPQPQPGDVVIVMEERGRKFVRSQQAVNTHVPALTSPTFSPGCRCKCLGITGLSFYLTAVRSVTHVLAVDAASGNLSQLIGRNELGYGVSNASTNAAALAVDSAAPHDLYVLDDRRGFETFRTDASPTAKRGYFGVARFIVSGGQYQFASYTPLLDPYTPGPHDPINPTTEPDPPAIPGNCLGIPDGIPLITMQKAPARYLAVAAGVVTSHTLNSSIANLALWGNIVRITDLPAKKARRYCIGLDGTDHYLLEFDPTTDTVSRFFTLTPNAGAVPKQLAVACNRLLILYGTLDTFGTS